MNRGHRVASCFALEHATRSQRHRETRWRHHLHLQQRSLNGTRVDHVFLRRARVEDRSATEDQGYLLSSAYISLTSFAEEDFSERSFARRPRVAVESQGADQEESRQGLHGNDQRRMREDVGRCSRARVLALDVNEPGVASLRRRAQEQRARDVQ